MTKAIIIRHPILMSISKYHDASGIFSGIQIEEGVFVDFKEMFHLLNTYFTRCCGIILFIAGCYFLYVAIRFIDENIIKVLVICFGGFSVIMGGKYLFESKNTSK